MKKTPRVLVAPLDWGLGHATRCIPVIRYLRAKGAEVHLASSGQAQDLLKLEFPELTHWTLPAYGVRYPEKQSFFAAMATQLPAFARAVAREQRVLHHLIREQGITHIVSDNRLGCYSEQVPSYIIVHQISILVPPTWRLARVPLNFIYQRYLGKFNACWIPDDPDVRLTGAMSMGSVKSEYIGWLSRFTRHGSHTEEGNIVVLLSGPEPSRTILETKILKQLARSQEQVYLVRGLPEEADTIECALPNVTIKNFLGTEALAALLWPAKLVICRSGYSSVMDLMKLGKRAVFIPTPGQTEQEFLARELERRRLAYYHEEKDFDFNTMVAESKKYDGFAGSDFSNDLLSATLDKYIFT